MQVRVLLPALYYSGMTDNGFFAARLLEQVDTRPILEVSAELLRHAQAAGFEYAEYDRAEEHFRDEVAEFLEALESGDPEAIEAEYADVVYAGRKLVDWKHADPERGMRSMLIKNLRRLEFIENRLAEQGLGWSDVTHDSHTDRLWHEAKEAGL